MNFLITRQSGNLRPTGMIHRLYLNDIEIGRMTTFVNYMLGEQNDKWVEIERLDNLTSHLDENKIKGVGTALLKEAIKRSEELGYKGYIKLQAVGKSHFFYWSRGFRPDPQFDQRVDYFGEDIGNKINNKEILDDCELKYYQKMKQRACKKYNTEEPTLEQIVTYYISDIMEAEYKKKHRPVWHGGSITRQSGNLRPTGMIHRLYLNDIEIGRMTTFVNYMLGEQNDKWVEIETLYNLTINHENKIKGVGTALLKDAIKRSEELGYKGCTKLQAIGDSHFFYWSRGFRPDPQFDKQVDYFGRIIYEKLKKNISLNNIETKYYHTLKQKALRKYNTEQLTAEQIVTYSLFKTMEEIYNKGGRQKWSGIVNMSYNNFDREVVFDIKL